MASACVRRKGLRMTRYDAGIELYLGIAYHSHGLTGTDPLMTELNHPTHPWHEYSVKTTRIPDSRSKSGLVALVALPPVPTMLQHQTAASKHFSSSTIADWGGVIGGNLASEVQTVIAKCSER